MWLVFFFCLLQMGQLIKRKKIIKTKKKDYTYKKKHRNWYACTLAERIVSGWRVSVNGGERKLQKKAPL